MQKGITQLVFGRDSSLEECLAFAKDAGYEVFEPAFRAEGPVSLHTGDAEIAQLMEWKEQYGLDYCTICGGAGAIPGATFTSENPEDRENAHQCFRKCLEIAGAIGAHSVLCVPGRVTEDMPYDVAMEHLYEELPKLAPVAEEHKVNLALENVWNRMLLSPLETRDLIDHINSPYVGVYFDTGNVVIYGYPEQWINILGWRIKAVHFKDFRRKGYEWLQLMDGDVDWPAVMAGLRNAGYDKSVVSEVGGDEEVLRETKRRMDEILQM